MDLCVKLDVFQETKYGAETNPYKTDPDRTPTQYHENHNTGVRTYKNK